MENKIKQILYSFGADTCGIAEAERFNGSRDGFHPLDIYGGCKSVIVFGKALPKGAFCSKSPLIYTKANAECKDEIDRITYLASLEIEKLGAVAVPVPSDSPYDYWDKDAMEGRGVMSMRHAAYFAGLGWIGNNTLLISPEFGTRLNISAILTDLSLASDEMCKNLCTESCNLCIKACPSGALSRDGITQKPCRQVSNITNARGFEVYVCNKCRTACPYACGNKR